MKSTIVSIATIAAALVGLVVVEEVCVVGKKAVEEDIRKKVADSRTKEENEVFETLKNYKRKEKELQIRESVQIENRVNDLYEELNYIPRKNAINEKVSETIKEYMESSGYEESKRLLENKRDEALDSWKQRNNYSKRIKEFEEMIDVVEKTSDRRKFVLDFSSDNSEIDRLSNEKITEAIDETTARIKKKAKKGIRGVEREFENYKETQDQKYNKAVEQLDSQLEKVRDKANEEAKKELDELSKELKDRKLEITKDVRSYRTPEEKDYVSKIELYSRKSGAILENEQRAIEEALNDVNIADKTAAYFKVKGIGKFGAACVFGVGLLPLLAVTYKIASFINEVFNKI